MSNVRTLTFCLLAALCANAREKLSLNECVDYALANSRELHKLRIAQDSQKLNTLVRRGKFRFGISASANHAIDDKDTTSSVTLKKELPGSIDVSTTGSVNAYDDSTDTAQLAFRISKVILGGGSVRESMLDIDNSVLDELVKQNQVRRYERELSYRVKQNVYGLIRNKQTLRINQMRLERAKKNLEHAVERERPLDIATARTEVPENEAAVLRAERLIASSLDALKELIGMDVLFDLELDTTYDFSERNVNANDDIIFCYANHEDVLNAELQKTKLENELPIQHAKRLPKVTVSGTATQPSDGGVNLNGDTDGTLGVSMAWEIGGVTERLNAERLANDVRSKQIDIHDLKQAKVRSIRDLARRLDETLQLIRLQEQKIKVAELRSELYADRWENGEIDILEYIRSQNDLENSRIALINLQTSYMELVGEYDFTVVDTGQNVYYGDTSEITSPQEGEAFTGRTRSMTKRNSGDTIRN